MSFLCEVQSCGTGHFRAKPASLHTFRKFGVDCRAYLHTCMNIFLKIGVFLIIAFIAVAAWLALRPASAPTPSTASPISTSTVATSSSQTPPSAATPSRSRGGVRLESVSPAVGLIGSTIELRGSGFTGDNQILLSGNVAARNVHLASVTNGHQILSFTIPSDVSPDCKPGMMCAMYVLHVTSGVYSVTVQNENGTSNALSLRVISSESAR